MKRLFADAGSVFVAQACSIMAAIATQSLLARFLAPAGRGEFAIMASIGTVAAVLFAVGSDRAAQYCVLSARMDLSKAVTASVLFALAATAMGAAALGVLSACGALGADLGGAGAISLLSVLMLANMLCWIGQLQLVAARAYKWLAAIALFQALGNVALLALAFGVFHLVSSRIAIGVLTVSTGAGALGQLGYLRLRHRWRFSAPTRSEYADILKYGIRYLPARVGNMWDSQYPVLILGMAGTVDDVGVFAALFALMMRLPVFAQSLETTLESRVASMDAPQLGAARMARIAFVVTGAGALGLIVVREPVIRLLLGPAFLPGAAVVAIVAPGVVLYSATTVLMAYLRQIGMPGACSIAVWVGLIAGAATLVPLYSVLGVPGAALAVAIGFGVRALALARWFSKASKMGFADAWLPRGSDFALSSKGIRGFE